jgi:hypothetical protein
MKLRNLSQYVAKPVTRMMGASAGVYNSLQRACACGQHTAVGGECVGCSKKRLQRKATNQDELTAVPSIVHEVLRSPGQPLDLATRTFIEPRFGHDFSAVRVHTDAQAAASARSVNALAYTVGHNVVFGSGQYAPTSTAGRRLIAHELAHVVQQQDVATKPLPTALRIGPQADFAEQEANTVAGAVLSGPLGGAFTLSQTDARISRAIDPSALYAPAEQKPRQRMGSTLPYREATELAECIRIMGEENAAYCRQTVLGEAPPTPGPAAPSLSVNPTEVQPRATGGVETSTVTVTGATPGTRLAPTVTAVANSGGHQHHNQRPVGTISPASRVVGAAGQAVFTYRSHLPGGIETVAVPVGGAVVQANIDVRVPALVELPAGADYDLVGQTATHPDNHFGAAATNASLQQIAANYEAHKVANNLPGWPRVAYNDISLAHGGIFDINGDWAPPHHTHRVGRNVDFRTNHLNAAQRAVLRGIINTEGGNILNEGNHWHLTF